MKLKKTLTKLVALSAAAGMVVSMMPTTAFAADPYITELPLTESTEKSYDSSFLSVTGFAKGLVNDRTQYLNTEYHRVCSTEYELLKALDDARNGSVKIIEITEDMDLGYEGLSEEAKTCASIAPYGQDNHSGVVSPAINTYGISQLVMNNVNGLTIFSRSGVTVRRAEWKLQGTCKDIVVRNIRFDGMWQWSDTNDTKAAGWSLMKVNGAKGVWFDHCSFTIGTDGNADSENGANGLTYSWCTFSMPTTEDPDKADALYQDIRYQEYLYETNQIDTTGRYYKMRKAGVTMKQILAYDAFHSKAFLIGSGDKDFTDSPGLQDGNQRLQVTFAYDMIYNIGQRFPRMRQGVGHLYNCYVNNWDHFALHNGVSAIKQYGGWSINRCINVHNGGVVGADTCVFNGVSQPLIGNESRGATSVPFENAYNRALIVNSTITKPDGSTYTGSSWDNNGNNKFTEGSFTWYDRSTLNAKKWSWHSSIVGVENLKRDMFATYAEQGMQFDFTYDYETPLPYSYTTMPLKDVTTVVEAKSGAYKLSQEPEFWLRTEYSADENIQFVDASVQVPVESVEMSMDKANVSLDSTLQLIGEVKPSHASNKEVTWTTSDPSVAEVLDSGLVVPKSIGTVTITATSDNGKTDSCQVTVYQQVTRVTLKSRSKSVEAGTDFTIDVTIKPDNATNKNVTWESSNTDVVTVDADGTIHAIAEGSATITCRSEENPSLYAQCVITVKPSSATATPIVTGTPDPTATPVPVLLGDVNLDGVVNASDALAILNHAAGIETITDATALTAADVNEDGTINASDALRALEIAAGM